MSKVGSLVLSYFPWSLLWNKTVQLNELAKHSQTPSSPSQLCSKNAGEQLLSDNPYPKEQIVVMDLTFPQVQESTISDVAYVQRIMSLILIV